VSDSPTPSASTPPWRRAAPPDQTWSQRVFGTPAPKTIRSSSPGLQGQTPVKRPEDALENIQAYAASGRILSCWLGGIALLVFGAIIAAASFPHASYGIEEGSPGGFMFAVFMIGVGEVVVLVGVIATGVKLGVTAARRRL
jgi:hypothetical protein